MAREIKSGQGIRVEAVKWEDGKLNVGVLVGADQPPRCDSLKYTLEGSGGFNAFWGTAALDKQMAQVKAGEFIRVECLGKGEEFETENAKGQKVKARAWQFKVLVADSDADRADWADEYRTYVMNGGK